MRTLSNNGDSEAWNALRVVPVSISYEWDPCDAFKMNELLHLEKHGTYTKADGEDERSMWTGLVGQKGKVHLQFGDVLPWQASSAKSSLNAPWPLQFDEALHRGMRAWPNQRLAAQHLGWSAETFAHVPEPTDQEVAAWFAKERSALR